ncbi:MAG: hypothetical protein P8M11_16960 [Planctomycetota bacterium]|nr:hypothetical protein [Planctomycetota bacterium]
MSAPARHAALLALACVLTLFTACAGAGGSPVGSSTTTAGRIVLRDYTFGKEMSLVSSSMLAELGYEGTDYEERRLSYYSQLDGDISKASTKACHDDAMTGLLQALKESGLDRKVASGPAAPVNDPGRSKGKSFEITVGGTTTHLDQQTDLPAFIQFMSLYVEVYNAYHGYNSVDGSVQFEQPKHNQTGGNR